MFREATEWSVLLQKTHVFMLPHTELVVFFANLNLGRTEQNQGTVACNKQILEISLLLSHLL